MPPSMTESERKIITLYRQLDPVQRGAIEAVIQSLNAGADASTAIGAGNMVLMANGLEPIPGSYHEG